MAKGKKTTALFDVISKSKRYQSAPRRSSSGSWWPFGRRRMAVTATSGATQTCVAPLIHSPPPPDIPAPRPIAHERVAPIEVARDHAASIDRQDEQDDSEHNDTLPTVAEPLRRPLEYAVDSNRRVIALRMNYTVAIVGGFALLVIVALAVIVGEHLRGEPPPMTPSVAAIRAGAPNRSFLNVPPKAVPGPVAHPKGTGELAARQIAADGSIAPPPFNEPRPPVDFSTDGKRFLGLNYVIIQSYHASEEKMAHEASEFLNNNGISCTIEKGKGLKGWPENSLLIIGTRGFDRVSTQPYKDYEALIMKLSMKYAGGAKSYKAFSTQPQEVGIARPTSKPTDRNATAIVDAGAIAGVKRSLQAWAARRAWDCAG